jgi:hypothetical protein
LLSSIGGQLYLPPKEERISQKQMRIAYRSGLIFLAPFVAVIAADPSHVKTANPKVANFSTPNFLSPELSEVAVARGSVSLENPTAAIGYYGYLANGPMLPAVGDVQSSTHNVEAGKTEPDKNTYLVLDGQHGADKDYSYGRHFLFQGHETGKGHITRINLDADSQHRVTLMASTDTAGNPLPLIDGSTWYPWAQRLLFTAENGNAGGVWQGTLDFPSDVEDISGVFGRAGYEGIQADSRGNLILVEDTGGAAGSVNSHAKQPNSFVYRLLPVNIYSLKDGGKLQALQVLNKSGNPIVFHAGQADADILSQDMKDLHTYGNIFSTRWVTIHDTTVDGIAPFDANVLAKAAGATPFKRPENGQFRPGTHFREFYFGETGDTNSLTEAEAEYGGFGSILKLTLEDSGDGTLSMLYRGDLVHTGFDNAGFWSADKIVFVEDAGDGLHSQRNALDSAWLFDARVNYASEGAPGPVRILAQGRDASATVDSALLGAGNGFQNEGDNEITGWHISNGDPSVEGLLGARIPAPFRDGWRVFYTAQHGDNVTYEVIPSTLGRLNDTFRTNDAHNFRDGR